MITKAIRDKLGRWALPTYLVRLRCRASSRRGLTRSMWGREMSSSPHVVMPASWVPLCGYSPNFCPRTSQLRQAGVPIFGVAFTAVKLTRLPLKLRRYLLTLADIPNTDGSRSSLRRCVPKRPYLNRNRRTLSILLANPPFMNFSAEERERYRSAGFECRYHNKTAEILRRTLPHLPDGSCFGVVLPQGFLHSSNAAELRRKVLARSEIDEILLFPDKVFAFSDIDPLSLIGRKHDRVNSVHQVGYRRVRERISRSSEPRYRRGDGAVRTPIPISDGRI